MNTFEILAEKAAPFMEAMYKARNARFQDSPFETVFFLEKGRKYHRVVQDTRNKETGEMFNQRSVAAFIDNDGNILKPASWKAPAKGIRGNIFNDADRAIDQSGYVVYLR